MPASTIRYVAYGSNLHPLRLGARLSSPILLGTALLRNRELRFHKRSVDGSGKCDLVDGSAGAYVAVYAISMDDRLRLDAIEGVGYGYRRKSFDVPGYGRCYAYAAESSHIDDSLPAYDWYRDLVVLGAAFHDFPDAYIDQIGSIPVIHDSDARRCGENRELAARMRRTLARP